jgi:hypothetical protein
LLPECDTCQKNAGEGYKLNDKSKGHIASDGRVEIQPKSGGGDQVYDSNSIAQVFVTHNFLLNDFLFMPLNVAVNCAGIVIMSVRSCGWLVQKVRQEPWPASNLVTRIRLNQDMMSRDKFCDVAKHSPYPRREPSAGCYAKAGRSVAK